MSLTGSGFPASKTLFVIQCADTSGQGGCNLGNLVPTPSSATGTFTASFTVHTGTIGDGTCAAGSTNCFIAVSDGTPANYAAVPISFGQTQPQGPLATTTTVSGPNTDNVGNPVTEHADVKTSGTAVPASAGSVQFAVNGTNSGSPVPLTATGADFTYTPAAPGSATITATFVPADSTAYSPSSDGTGVTVATTTATYAPDPQTVVVTVPAGTLVISTPYTAANPFNLGTAKLNADGTALTASAPFGSATAPATTDPGQNGSVSNGVTITDTRANSTGWTASAQTNDFTGPAGNTTPIPGDNLTFTGVHPKYLAGNTLQTGSVTTNDIDHFKAGPKSFATTTHGPGSVNVYGVLGLTASTSTTPGQYTATVTFTIA